MWRYINTKRTNATIEAYKRPGTDGETKIIDAAKNRTLRIMSRIFFQTGASS